MRHLRAWARGGAWHTPMPASAGRVLVTCLHCSHSKATALLPPPAWPSCGAQQSCANVLWTSRSANPRWPPQPLPTQVCSPFLLRPQNQEPKGKHAPLGSSVTRPAGTANLAFSARLLPTDPEGDPQRTHSHTPLKLGNTEHIPPRPSRPDHSAVAACEERSTRTPTEHRATCAHIEHHMVPHEGGRRFMLLVKKEEKERCRAGLQMSNHDVQFPALLNSTPFLSSRKAQRGRDLVPFDARAFLCVL